MAKVSFKIWRNILLSGVILIIFGLCYKNYNISETSIDLSKQCARIDDLIEAGKARIAIRIADSLIKSKNAINPKKLLSRKGKKLFPSDIIWLRAYAKSQINNDTGAIRDYTLFLSDSNSAENRYSAYGNRGILKQGFGDIKGAFDDYAIAVKLNEKDPFTHWNRANLFVTIREYQKALKDFRAAIKTDPKDAEQIVNFGNCYYSIAQTDSACILWRKAGELGSKDAYDNIKIFCK
jgi:tetratricopeptide (TPR) repeat protein